MISRLVDMGEWGLESGRRLAAIRRRNGHNQTEFATLLRELGADCLPSQSTVSNWECGKTHQPSHRSLVAIEAYISQSDPLSRTEVGPAAKSAGVPYDEVSDSIPAQSVRDIFEAMVSSGTGFRPLNDRQGKLIDALTRRLSSGPRLSDADGLVAQSLLRELNIGE